VSDEDERDELTDPIRDREPDGDEAATARVRRLILARRNHFMVAALAGLGIGCSSPSANRPNPFLRVAAPKDGGGGAATDAAAPAAKDATAQPIDDEDGGRPDAAPKVCLTIT
jgi:hypothetical protein